MTEKVIIGKFGKTFGVHGWIKVHSFSYPTTNITSFLPWLIADHSKKNDWQKIISYKWQQQGQTIIVQLPAITTPEQAQLYVNKLIAIERSQLPAPAKDEFYWIDLISCKVINTRNIELGHVEDVFATVSNDVLVVKNKLKQCLIPFLKNTIINVDLSQKIITVDWDENF